MTEKQNIIRAFKALDFNILYQLLDENRSYMDVSKDLFLSSIKNYLEEYGDISSYEKVIVGLCGSCNEGCKAYKFVKEGYPSLNLYFEEENEKVTDIYLGNALRAKGSYEDEDSVYFTFYEEEHFNYKPSIKHLIDLQKIEDALEDFENLAALGLVPIQDVLYWHKKYTSLFNELNLYLPFGSKKYKAFRYISSLACEVYGLDKIAEKNAKAKIALSEYNSLDLDNERSIVHWVLKHEDNYIHSLEKTNNWEQTGILILDTKPKLVLDCCDYLDAYLFKSIHDKHEMDLYEKYQPTKEHFVQSSGSVDASLRSLFRLHGVYFDLLKI